MTIEFKKHVVFGTFFSLILLVGCFQASHCDSKKGLLVSSRSSTVGVWDRFGAPVVHVAKDTLPGQIAGAALTASTVEALVTRVVTGKFAKDCSMGVGLDHGSRDNYKNHGLRVGYFNAGFEYRTDNEVSSDDGKVVKVPTTWLEKVRSTELYVGGATVPNALKTALVFCGAKVLAARLSK